MKKTNALFVGSGAREHALEWAIGQSPHIGDTYAMPGNAGMAASAHISPIAANDALRRSGFFLSKEGAQGLVVIGPDRALADGEADRWLAAGVPVFGPTRRLARLEFSKVFAKEVMRHLHILTPQCTACHSLAAVEDAITRLGHRFVIKQNELADGKGVQVFKKWGPQNEVLERGLAWPRMLFEEQPDRILLVEEYIPGTEASATIVADGTRWALLPSAEDYKQSGEGDTGNMTGGMGCITPASILNQGRMQELWHEAVMRIVPPLLAWCAKEDPTRGFRGCLYLGLKWTEGKAYVLEINVRFGDPEAQVLLANLVPEVDVLELLWCCATGTLDRILGDRPDGTVIGTSKRAATVVVAGMGYPDHPRSLYFSPDALPTPPEGVQVFHANTKRLDTGMLTSEGGRVFSVTATHPTSLDHAVEMAHAHARRIVASLPGTRIRGDIGMPKDPA